MSVGSQLGGGPLPPLVEEEAGDQEEDGREHDRPPRAALPAGADERENDCQDASEDCDDPEVFHGDLPARRLSSELRMARGLFYHNAGACEGSFSWGRRTRPEYSE